MVTKRQRLLIGVAIIITVVSLFAATILYFKFRTPQTSSEPDPNQDILPSDLKVLIDANPEIFHAKDLKLEKIPQDKLKILLDFSALPGSRQVKTGAL